jgi:hypothetical protein
MNMSIPALEGGMSDDLGDSTVLAARAEELSAIIYGALNKGRLKPADLAGYRVAYDIASRLGIISAYIGPLPPYWIEDDIEKLCRTILQDLQAVSQPKTTQTTSGATFIIPRLSYFAPSFGRNDSDPESHLVTFFKTRAEDARRIKTACDELIKKLTKDDIDAEGLPEAALQSLDALDSRSAIDNDGIFKAFQSIAECDPASHEQSAADCGDMLNMQWHPARLCLHELHVEDSAIHGNNIMVLVSALDMSLWQEFCLKT